MYVTLIREIVISPKLELCGANEVNIRNQRPRLRRNRLILASQRNGGAGKYFRALKYRKAKFCNN